MLNFILFHLCIFLVGQVVPEPENRNQTLGYDHHIVFRREASLNPFILYSSKSIFDHVKWGQPRNRKYHGTKHLESRYYFGYGSCPETYPIQYKPRILMAPKLESIIAAYMEMFRLSCQEDSAKTYMNLFDKGYAELAKDHSIDFSYHISIFVKPNPTIQDMEDFENLLEFSAFTQTYVSWFNFPVNSIDPFGNPLTDSCFIEIIARLHVLDLTLVVAKRHLTRMAYFMGLKLKPILKLMIQEYQDIAVHDIDSKRNKKMAKQCLIVSTALFEFLFKSSHLAVKTNCAHVAFKNFFQSKQNIYNDYASKF